jgi:hypothetical protein
VNGRNRAHLGQPDQLGGDELGLALEILNRELGLERLLLDGGGGSNGALLRAGLIDEELADWSAGRDAVYQLAQLAALAVGARLAVFDM